LAGGLDALSCRVLSSARHGSQGSPDVCRNVWWSRTTHQSIVEALIPQPAPVISRALSLLAVSYSSGLGGHWCVNNQETSSKRTRPISVCNPHRLLRQTKIRPVACMISCFEAARTASNGCIRSESCQDKAGGIPGVQAFTREKRAVSLRHASEVRRPQSSAEELWGIRWPCAWPCGAICKPLRPQAEHGLIQRLSTETVEATLRARAGRSCHRDILPRYLDRTRRACFVYQPEQQRQSKGTRMDLRRHTSQASQVTLHVALGWLCLRARQSSCNGLGKARMLRRIGATAG
jgi:hypothetical protein